VGQQLAEGLRERLALFHLRGVAASLEHGQRRGGDQPVDLLGLVDGTDPVVPSHRDQGRTGDAG
jgi:hypothetical protein